MGRQIKVEGSQLPAANKIWNIYGLDLDLDAKMPDGQWFARIQAFDPSFPAPVRP